MIPNLAVPPRQRALDRLAGQGFCAGRADGAGGAAAT